MLFADISIIDEHFAHRAHQWVGVRAGRIAYVGNAEPADAAAFGERYDGANRLLTPAFYNAHAHAPMTLLRGYAEDAPLQTWLTQLVWPFEAQLTADDCYWATLLSCAEMARYGVVGFNDMYGNIASRAQAVAEAGCKANLSAGVIAPEPKPWRELKAHESYEEAFAAGLQGACDGRIALEAAVHAEYTTCEPVLREIIAFARERNLGIHLHLSETRAEHEECQARHEGRTPAQYFDDLGLFEGRTVAAHCTWATQEDAQLLAARGVFAALCPASNMKFGSGFVPVPSLLRCGVPVCLGTDGMASNNNHDMLQDAYVLALTQKGATADPCVLSPEQLLAAATRTGALAQGRPDCGLVKEGFKADLAVFDTAGPSWQPCTNVVRNLMYAGHGSDCVLTLCDGKVVYRAGTWPGIDYERVAYEVNARAQRIIAALCA